MRPNEHRPRHILVVDDDPGVSALLRHVLQAEGYEVLLAPDGIEALAQASRQTPDLVLLDLDLPGVGGFEVCQRLKQEPATRLVPVLILTGRASSEARLRAWELGADEFLNKPFQSLEVAARCRSLLRQKELVDELDSAHAVVFAFARAVEAKCRYTLGHSERVTHYALLLADRVGLPAGEREIQRRGAVLHDVGKISTPDAILNKPGPLTAEEFAIIKRHPLEGARIVEPLRSVRDTLPLIRWHHERLDGAGYPDGLFGGSIPLGVRVLAVADVYDALSSVRPYRPAMSHAACLLVMEENAAGGGLDPELVRLFREAMPESGAAALVPSASGWV